MNKTDLSTSAADFNSDDRENISDAIEYTISETSYRIRGPQSPADAVLRYSNACFHYSLYSVRFYDELANRVRSLTLAEARALIALVEGVSSDN